jgi:hypothetical protein
VLGSCEAVGQRFSPCKALIHMYDGWYALACMLEMSKRDCRCSGLGEADAWS